MDKVTQQNAANAEESASAAEQLSAQAENVKTTVNALSAIVGGSGGGGRDARSTQVSSPVSIGAHEHAPATAHSTNSNEPASSESKLKDF
jgi:methyl-accepting chemotaxis protein